MVKKKYRTCFFGLNPFGILPLMRYIIPLFPKESTFIYTTHIQGFYDFHEVATQKNLRVLKDVNALNSQSWWNRTIHYGEVLYYLFREVIFYSNTHFYIIDFQVLAILLWIKKHLARHIHITYHQFELFNPQDSTGVSRQLQLYIFKNAQKIDVLIFPEKKRLDYFLKQSSFFSGKMYILPNTNNLLPQPGKEIKSILDIPKGTTVVAHIGSLGPGHYGYSLIQFIQNNKDADLRFLFVGRLEKTMREQLLALKEQDDRVLLIDEMPHDQLIQYYSQIDIGLVLYKGFDLNHEYCAPNKLYEYWAWGIPVIAHDLQGLQSVWVSPQQGILIDLESQEKLGKAIHELRNRPATRKLELQSYFQKELSFNAHVTGFISTLND